MRQLEIEPQRNLERTIFYEKVYYFHSHHRSTHQNTMNYLEVLREKPTKQFKNTDCPYSMSIRSKHAK